MKMRLSRSIVGETEAEAVRRVICDDGYLGMGSETRLFEENIARYLGVEPERVISVNSGTAALHLAVQAVVEKAKADGKLESMPGSPEIIVPTLTFVASFQAIIAAGAKPIPCDVLLETGTIALAEAQKLVGTSTLAIMHVDYASNPWRLSEVYSFAKENNIRVIDDAAHAFGCRHHGRKIGSFGDLVCFSFDGIKNITCGEGGCLLAFDEFSARIASDARLLGVEGDTAKRFSGQRSWDPDVKIPGWRYHMSNIMAAIGNAQLDRLEKEFIPARRKLYGLYAENLKDIAGIKLLKTDPDDFIVPHIMPVRILDGRKARAERVLEMAGIPAGVHYKPNHLLTLFGGGKISLPNAEKLYSELLTLPLHPGLEESDVEFVCVTLKKALN